MKKTKVFLLLLCSIFLSCANPTSTDSSNIGESSYPQEKWSGDFSNTNSYISFYKNKVKIENYPKTDTTTDLESGIYNAKAISFYSLPSSLQEIIKNHFDYNDKEKIPDYCLVLSKNDITSTSIELKTYDDSRYLENLRVNVKGGEYFCFILDGYKLYIVNDKLSHFGYCRKDGKVTDFSEFKYEYFIPFHNALNNLHNCGTITNIKQNGAPNFGSLDLTLLVEYSSFNDTFKTNLMNILYDKKENPYRAFGSHYIDENYRYLEIVLTKESGKRYYRIGLLDEGSPFIYNEKRWRKTDILSEEKFLALLDNTDTKPTSPDIKDMKDYSGIWQGSHSYITINTDGETGCIGGDIYDYKEHSITFIRKNQENYLKLDGKDYLITFNPFNKNEITVNDKTYYKDGTIKAEDRVSKAVFITSPNSLYEWGSGTILKRPASKTGENIIISYNDNAFQISQDTTVALYPYVKEIDPSSLPKIIKQNNDDKNKYDSYRYFVASKNPIIDVTLKCLLDNYSYLVEDLVVEGADLLFMRPNDNYYDSVLTFRNNNAYYISISSRNVYEKETSIARYNQGINEVLQKLTYFPSFKGAYSSSSPYLLEYSNEDPMLNSFINNLKTKNLLKTEKENLNLDSYRKFPNIVVYPSNRYLKISISSSNTPIGIAVSDENLLSLTNNPCFTYTNKSLSLEEINSVLQNIDIIDYFEKAFGENQLWKCEYSYNNKVYYTQYIKILNKNDKKMLYYDNALTGEKHKGIEGTYSLSKDEGSIILTFGENESIALPPIASSNENKIVILRDQSLPQDHEEIAFVKANSITPITPITMTEDEFENAFGTNQSWTASISNNYGNEDMTIKITDVSNNTLNIKANSINNGKETTASYMVQGNTLIITYNTSSNTTESISLPPIQSKTDSSITLVFSPFVSKNDITFTKVN